MMNQTPQDLQAIDQDDALLDSIVARHRVGGDDPAARLLSGIVAALEEMPVPDATATPAPVVPHGRRWGVRAGITGALTAGVLAGSLGAAAADVLPGPAQTVVAAFVNAMTPLHLPTRKEHVQLRHADDTTGNQPAPWQRRVTSVAPTGPDDNQPARTSRTTQPAPGQQPSATSTSSGSEPELHPAGQTGVNEADTNQGGQLGVPPSGTDQTSTDQTSTDPTGTDRLMDP